MLVRTLVTPPRRAVRAAGAFALATLLAAAAHAQDFPNRPIRLVVSAGVSTPPDIVSRIVTNEIQNTTPMRFVIENKVGAAQTVAAADVLRSPADGYALLAISIPATTAPVLIPGAKVNFVTDFDPVIELVRSYNVLVVNPELKAKTVGELVALLKAEPGRHNFASGGVGSPAHLIGEMFRAQIGADAAHVPYNQFPQALQDLMTGRTQFGFLTTLPVVELIASGKLRALAVTGPNRIGIIKDTPTIVEQGFPGLVVADWVGLLVAKGAPPAAVATLNGAFNKALQAPAVRAAIDKLGAEPVGGAPAVMGALVASDTARWGEVLRKAGVKPQ